MKVDKSCRINRTFEDYQTFMLEHPGYPVRQLDSVEGVRGGAVLLTIHFVQQELQLAFLRRANEFPSVIAIFEKLYFDSGRIFLWICFPFCWRIMAVNFPIRAQLNLTSRETAEPVCSIVIQAPLIKKGTVKTTMK